MTSIISTGPWLIGYDTKAGIWCAYHKDRPEEEWNAYAKHELLWQLDHADDPNNQDMITRQVVKR